MRAGQEIFCTQVVENRRNSNVVRAECIHALGHKTGMGILERTWFGRADGVHAVEGKGGVV